MHAEEQEFANLKTSVKVEEFVEINDRRLPFFKREGKPVQAIGSRERVYDPIFLFPIGEHQRLSVALLHEHNSVVAVKRILSVKAILPDGRCIKLPTQQTKTGEFECHAMVLLKPIETECEMLLTPSPCDGRHENSVALSLVIAVSMFTDGAQAIELKHRIYCQVTESSQKVEGHEETCNPVHQWRECPSTMMDESPAASVVYWRIKIT